MAITAAETLTSYVTATPSWRRSAARVQNLATNEPYDWDGHGDAALGTPALSFDTAALTPGTPTRILAARTLAGASSPGIVGTSVWFEDVHTIPRLMELGLVVSTRSIAVEVYNAYRRTSQSFTGWTNNAGTGVDLIGETFPTTFGPLQGSGTDLSVQVSTAGPPIVDETLLFSWSGIPADNLVVIRFTRVLPLAVGESLLVPEDGYTELLLFRTDVIERPTGKEQRFKLRKNPRQVFEHVYKIDEGPARSAFDSALANLQHRLWGVGVWDQETRLTVAATAGDSTLQVVTTAYSDFREGGTCAVFIPDTYYDLRGIETVTSTTLVLSDAVEHDYPVGARIVPIRSAHLAPELEGRRWPVNLAERPLSFQVVDGDANLEDVTAWTDLDGKVLLDGWNVMGATNPEGMVRDWVDIDSDTGARYVDSNAILSRFTGLRTFLAQNAAAKWNLRGLLWALAGRWKSFYTPSWRADLTVSETLVSGENRLFIYAAGYTDNVTSRAPLNRIRVELTDGTTYDRIIESSEESASGEFETLTLDANWPADIDPEDVALVSFILPARFDTDTIRIEHERGSRSMRVAVPWKAVLD